MAIVEETKVELFSSNRHIAVSDMNRIYLKMVDDLIRLSNNTDCSERAVYHSELAGVSLFYKKLCDELDKYKENEANG